MCLTIEEARRVRAAVAAAAITLMCSHNQLFLPPVAAARQLLQEGILGTVYEARTTDCFYNDFDPSTMGWRAHRSTSGGGELIDTGYHPTYLLLYLMDSEPIEVIGDAEPSPADVHGGRGFGPGRRPLRGRVGRDRDHQLGVRAGRLDRAVLGRRRSRQPVE